MAACIVCWTVPKLVADLWEHCTDFIKVWTSLSEETLLVKAGTIAFDAIMKLMETFEVVKTIDPVHVC